MKGIRIDTETNVVEEHFAVIYAPRRQRDRFAENCVEIVDSADAAVNLAQPQEARYPAKVVGPSRSSEGLRLYYLIQWLD